MLGSLNGVTNIGESQKLIVNLDMTENTPDYVNNIPGKGVKPCKTCGPFCSVYTHEFRRELKENQQDWYIKIARQSKTNILVSSEIPSSVSILTRTWLIILNSILIK